MRESRRNLMLACALSAIAGYVDGIGFLHLGGLFVSFMSGNSTRMGVSLAAGNWTAAGEALSLIALFVLGAACGSLIVLGRGQHSQSRLLLIEALLLAAAARSMLSASNASRSPSLFWQWDLENAVFQIEGGSGLGLTYVTGALVKVGQLIAAALTGVERLRGRRTCCCGWRRSADPYLARWPATGSTSPRFGLPRPGRSHCAGLVAATAKRL